MPNYYLGADISKGYSDFIMLDAAKRPIEDSFQLDDTFEGHHQLYSIVSKFCDNHPEASRK